MSSTSGPHVKANLEKARDCASRLAVGGPGGFVLASPLAVDKTLAVDKALAVGSNAVSTADTGIDAATSIATATSTATATALKNRIIATLTSAVTPPPSGVFKSNSCLASQNLAFSLLFSVTGENLLTSDGQKAALERSVVATIGARERGREKVERAMGAERERRRLVELKEGMRRKGVEEREKAGREKDEEKRRKKLRVIEEAVGKIKEEGERKKRALEKKVERVERERRERLTPKKPKEKKEKKEKLGEKEKKRKAEEIEESENENENNSDSDSANDNDDNDQSQSQTPPQSSSSETESSSSDDDDDESEPEQLSDYEKLRLDRIKRNAAHLASLGLGQTLSEIRDANKKKRGRVGVRKPRVRRERSRVSARSR